MKKTIKDLKGIIKKYKTSLDISTSFRFSDNDLETLRKAIRYLELVDGLADSYKGDKHE